MFYFSAVFDGKSTRRCVVSVGDSFRKVTVTSYATDRGTVWKEFITSRHGVVITRGSNPVASPRKHRYLHNIDLLGNVFFIKKYVFYFSVNPCVYIDVEYIS